MTPHKSKIKAIEAKAIYEDKGTVTNNGHFTNQSVNTVHFSSSENSIGEVESTLLEQEMFATGSLCLSKPSSDDKLPKSASETGRPGCSYIEEYSHVPETSAFYRLAHKPGTTSTQSKETRRTRTERSPEQYSQNIAAFDGITTRSKRQTASVSTPRDDSPKKAFERVHKLRKKLNPVRDYRLMDTVHYLAQGEFAPRDDGIKLTPSREAVLSDIIWEDICRTHWPSTRLSPATAPTERSSTRRELQRLIDSLLRERIAHVERRKRRHYRSVKINNNRVASSRPIGKTGDIIVATQKDNERLTTGSDHDTRKYLSSYKNNRSHDNFDSSRHRCCYPALDCPAGPSNAVDNPLDLSVQKYRRTSKVPKPLPTLTVNVNKVTASSDSDQIETLSNQPRLFLTSDTTRDLGVEIMPAIMIRTSSAVKQYRTLMYQRIINYNKGANVSGEYYN